MTVYTFNCRYRIFSVMSIYTPSTGITREVSETWSEIGSCYFDSSTNSLWGSHFFTPSDFVDVQTLEGAEVLPAATIAPKSTSHPNFRLSASSSVGTIDASDAGSINGYMNWRAKGAEQDYDVYVYMSNNPNWPDSASNTNKLIYCFGPIYLADGHSLPDNRLNITYRTFRGYHVDESSSVPGGILVEFRIEDTNAIGLYMLDTTNKPEKDNPIIADTVNKLYIRDKNNAIVYYIHQGRNYTQALYKGLGGFWYGLGDGYVTKALVMDHYAWVFIGSDKYVIKSQGMGLNTYG